MTPVRTPPAGTPAVDPSDPTALVYGKLIEVSECVSGMRSELGTFMDSTGKRLDKIEGRIGSCEEKDIEQDKVAAEREAKRVTFRARMIAVAVTFVGLAGLAFAVIELFAKR